MAEVPSKVTVPVVSDWKSKINWTQIASIGTMVLAYVGLPVDPSTLALILLGIAGGYDTLTLIIRTFFTKAVTESSAAK